MNAVELRWCCAENKPGADMPEWARSAALAPDGTVFLPAAVAGDEAQIMLCACSDGATIVTDGDHTYVPADWMAREFPEAAEVCAVITTAVRDHFRSEAE